MSAVIEEADHQQRHDPQALAGQEHIRRRWSCLAPSTRELLMKSGYYDLRGNRLQPEVPPPSWLLETDAERLESALGAFKLCLAAKVPSRQDPPGTPIPVEAVTKEVLSACDEILMVPLWHDPEFLRFGLLALAAHQQADALSMAAPDKSLSVWRPLLAMLGRGVLVLLAPYGLATGLMAVLRQELWPAIGGFFLLAWGVSAAVAPSAAAKCKPSRAPTASEDLAQHFLFAYNAWSRFRYDQQLGLVGAAARFYLERMANEGVNVPPVAFDLCEALRARMQSLAAGAP